MYEKMAIVDVLPGFEGSLRGAEGWKACYTSSSRCSTQPTDVEGIDENRKFQQTRKVCATCAITALECRCCQASYYCRKTLNPHHRTALARRQGFRGRDGSIQRNQGVTACDSMAHALKEMQYAQEKRKSGAEAGGGEALDSGGVARSLSPRSDSLREHSDLT